MRRLIVAAACASMLALGACTSFNPSDPLIQPTPDIQADVAAQFQALDLALGALPLVPGMPAIVVQEAKAADAALKAAWVQYQAAPTAAGSVTALSTAIAAAEAFLANQAKPAVQAAQAKAAAAAR